MTQIRRRELRTNLLWAPRSSMGTSPASGRWRSSSIRDHNPVLRHSAALLEGRSGAAALLGSSRAMVPRVLSAVDGRMKTIALPQHEKARRPRGRRRCVGPNLARLGHGRGAEGAHVHAHDDCCKRCAAAIGRKIFPRIIECGAASRGWVLLCEDHTQFLASPTMSRILRSPT